MNTYTFNAVCTCPADKLPDSYAVTVESRRMLWTNKACSPLTILCVEGEA